MSNLSTNHRIALVVAIVGILTMLGIAYVHHDGWQVYAMTGLFAVAVGSDTYHATRGQR